MLEKLMRIMSSLIVIAAGLLFGPGLNISPFVGTPGGTQANGRVGIIRPLNGEAAAVEGSSESQSAAGPALVKLEPGQEQRDWAVWGGNPENNHYSSLTQINQNNVKQLRLAWSFDSQEEGGLQTSPIVVEGVLYGITPTQKIFALDAATGKLFWKFDSGVKGTQPDRGLAFWADGKDKRILVGIMNFVYALDAVTGQPIAGFGTQGRIDLRENLGREPATSQSIYMTSPGTVYKDLLIVGGRNPETSPSPPGDVRAFDVRTGKLRWSFHTIPHRGEVGYETWPKEAWKSAGAANNWAGMALDAKRGIVYVPTGSPVSDFYGADRLGDDLFADCVIALNAQTGERIWHFQGVRHDIWDRDFPAAPVLLTVQRADKKIDAVAQTTKQGFVYLFDRADGSPLFPIEYHKYPASTVPGEWPLPTNRFLNAPHPSLDSVLPRTFLPTVPPKPISGRWRNFASSGVMDSSFPSASELTPWSFRASTVVGAGRASGRSGNGFDVCESNDVAWTGALTPNAGENSARGHYLNQCGVRLTARN